MPKLKDRVQIFIDTLGNLDIPGLYRVGFFIKEPVAKLDCGSTTHVHISQEYICLN